MIKVDITANNVASSYRVPMILGESILGLKWDSGAKYTVISVKVLNSDLSDKDLEGVKQYCDGRSSHREQFVSASGHTFDGYLVKANDVTIGNTVFPEFHFYLMILIWIFSLQFSMGIQRHQPCTRYAILVICAFCFRLIRFWHMVRF